MPSPETGTIRPSDTSKVTLSTLERRKGKRRRDDGRIYLGPKDPGFQENILEPCGVRTQWMPTEKNVTPNTIFGKQSQKPTSSALLVFDNAESRKIRGHLVHYERRGDDENALAGMLASSLLVREYLQEPHGPAITTFLRKDRWRPHKPGPTIENAVYFSDWDVEADVTYAVSINQFELDVRRRLGAAPLDRWLAESEASCPYLSIEYKYNAKTGKKMDAANQNTIASVIWLYQRRSMRQEPQHDFMDLRHYLNLVVDGHFEVWEARCEGEGFLMQILAKGDLTDAGGLQRYVDWSNAVHTWGLGLNASSFKEDVLKLLKRLDEGPASTPESLTANAKPAEASAPVSVSLQAPAQPANAPATASFAPESGASSVP